MGKTVKIARKRIFSCFRRRSTPFLLTIFVDVRFRCFISSLWSRVRGGRDRKRSKTEETFQKVPPKMCFFIL